MISWSILDADHPEYLVSFACRFTGKPLEGKTIEVKCYFDHDMVWFLSTMENEKAKRTNYCMAFDRKGKLLKSLKADADLDTWLRRIRGKCAVNNSLLTPVNAGITQVAFLGDKIHIKRYPDAEEFVNTETDLFAAEENKIFAVKTDGISEINFKIKTPKEVRADEAGLIKQAKEKIEQHLIRKIHLSHKEYEKLVGRIGGEMEVKSIWSRIVEEIRIARLEEEKLKKKNS